MKFSNRVLAIVTAAFWFSAWTLFLAGGFLEGLGILRWIALPDALIAAALTYVLIRRWTLQ